MADQRRRPSAALPCCVLMFHARKPSTISSPHSLHFTLTFYCSRYESPSPVIRLPYTTSNLVPAAWYERQTLPTVFPILVRRSFLLNRTTNLPGAITGLTMKPCHCPCRRGHFDAYPVFHVRCTLPRPPPSRTPSDALPHPPPH